MYTLEIEVTPRVFTVLFSGYAEQDEFGPAGQFNAFPIIEEVYEVVDDGDTRQADFSRLPRDVQVEIEDAAANFLVDQEHGGEREYYND